MQPFDILIKVIPILVAIALGYALTKKGVLTSSMVDAFKKIVVNVTLPAALFAAFIKIDFKAEYALIIVSVFAACVLLFYIGKLIAKMFHIKSPYFPFLMTAFEAGMIGYALFTTVFGTDAAADFGVVDIGQVSFVFLVFVPMVINLNSKEKGLGSIKTSLKTAGKSPVIWAILLGVIGAVAGLGAYQQTGVFQAFDNIFAFAAAPMPFLICLVIGSGLKLSLKSMKLEFVTAALKVALGLLFAFILKIAVFVPLGADPRIVTALFALACLPAPFVLPVFMKEPSEENVGFVSNTLSIGSILGVLCFVAVVLIGL